MAHSTSITHIGDKLVVGQVDTSFLSATSRILPGTAVLNGPVVIGATGGLGVDRATCMIGPPLLGLAVPASLEVLGITNIIGTLNVPAVSFFTGLLTASGGVIINAIETKNGLDLKNSLNLGNDLSICNAPMVVNSIIKTEDVFASGPGSIGLNATTSIAEKALELAISKKGFDIQHPSKEGYRLRHICIEGPTADVYFRGKLFESNEIVVPEYWLGLVDPDSILVSLTPIGLYQELFVEKIEWGRKIIIKNNLGSPVNCYYIVYGERIDGEKNIPVYEGLTPKDYPGDNDEYVINGL
jgi:hypothetical protein